MLSISFILLGYASKAARCDCVGMKTGAESREQEEARSSGSPPSEGRQADGSSGPSVLDMGSTDSAGSAHSGGSSCGLVSSLFPSSCRGRAEAFARRLHRRLTFLGGEDGTAQRDSETSKPKETSWLHVGNGNRTITTNSDTNHVLQRQPRHSPETDLYYDFDLDLEDDGPGSPAEEATAAELADLLVNRDILKSNHHEACHCSPGSLRSDINQDPESGCVFASPVSGTSPESDTSEVYFDPESSDAEKGRNDVFFDIVTTSESEATPAGNLSHGGVGKLKLDFLPGHRRGEKPVENSESESSSLRTTNSCDKRSRSQDELVCSSEDSLNGRSSLETTSPSHESLWSTFDDSTMSLQDDSPSRASCNTVTVPHIRLPKSHSDSEIPVNGSRIPITCTLPRRDEENEDDSVDEVDFVNGLSDHVKIEEDIKNAKNLVKEEPHDDAESIKQEAEYDEEEVTDFKDEPSKSLLNVKIEEPVTSDTDTDHSTYSSTINIPGALTLECPGERVVGQLLKNEVNLQIENGTVLNGSDEEKMCILLKKLGSQTVKAEDTTLESENQQNSIEEEEEEEGEEDRPQRVRRCSSLKTGKTPPGTPGRKKIVRFADVLGLDLADVRTFLDEIPKIPNSAYSDLIYDDIFQKDTSPVNTAIAGTWDTRYMDRRESGPTPGIASALNRKLDRTLVPLFQQPGGLSTFLDLVRERRVCLENVLVQDPVSLCIRGTVRVINLDFHKSVHIRYTLNSWRNFSDLQATYVPNSCDGFSDKFSFVLYCHTLTIGQRLEFAVRFQCKGVQYWDNNAGQNYCFQCLPNSSPVAYIPITAAGNRTSHSDWSPMFY